MRGRRARIGILATGAVGLSVAILVGFGGWLGIPGVATAGPHLAATPGTTTTLVAQQPALAGVQQPNVPVVLPTELDVIGDSLTVGIKPYLPGLAATYGFPVHIDARVGRRTPEGLDHLQQMAPAPGAVVVMALGTNDTDSSTYSNYIDTAMAQLPDALRVVWLTVQRPGGEPKINAAIRQAGITYAGRLVVADWASVLAAHPEYLGGDGPHCTPDGYRARAAFILSAVLGIQVSSTDAGPGTTPTYVPSPYTTSTDTTPMSVTSSSTSSTTQPKTTTSTTASTTTSQPSTTSVPTSTSTSPASTPPSTTPTTTGSTTTDPATTIPVTTPPTSAALP